MAIKATAARYISFADGGFSGGARERGDIPLRSVVPDQLARQGSVEEIAEHLSKLGYGPLDASREAQAVCDFYQLGEDCLWFTIAEGRLWWTFAAPQVATVSIDFIPTNERVRKSIGGWRDTDANGEALSVQQLGRADAQNASLSEILDFINGRDLASPDRRKIPSKLYRVEDVLMNPSAAPDEAGLYTWWFDDLPGVPLEDAIEQDGFRLAYVGIAAYRPESRRTLRQRLRNHCNGPIATSTLRRSLASLLFRQLNLLPIRSPGFKTRLGEGEEARLTAWVARHGRVAWCPTSTPWLLEEEILKDGPPLALNIRGNNHRFVPTLLELRKQLSDLPA